MTDQEPPKHKLNDPQWFALRAIASQIVPPSAKYGVPGGGDEQICKQVLKDVGERLPSLIETLETLNAMAREIGGQDLGAVAEATHERIAVAFKQAHPKPAERLALWLTQCYYRDDRVIESLGLEARPPFPQGYDVESGDWSELAPVLNRTPLFRDVT